MLVMDFELQGIDLAAWQGDRIRLFLGNGYTEATKLLLLLTNHVTSVRVAGSGGERFELGAHGLRASGFDVELLPCPSHAFPGFRCVQEFFGSRRRSCSSTSKDSGAGPIAAAAAASWCSWRWTRLRNGCPKCAPTASCSTSYPPSTCFRMGGRPDRARASRHRIPSPAGSAEPPALPGVFDRPGGRLPARRRRAAYLPAVRHVPARRPWRQAQLSQHAARRHHRPRQRSLPVGGLSSWPDTAAGNAVGEDHLHQPLAAGKPEAGRLEPAHRQFTGSHELPQHPGDHTGAQSADRRGASLAPDFACVAEFHVGRQR